MNYKQFTEWAQNQVDALPIRYAFGDKQFNEMLVKYFNGITCEDAKQQLYGNGVGGYYWRTDAEQINNTFKSISDTQQRLIDEDTTGDGFIYEMFLYELDNHEYSYTQDVNETLDAIGLTVDDLNGSSSLMRGLKKAIEEINNR